MKLRALVLAAGRGTRLAPLTEDRPKPLLPILGQPILTWTLERLGSVGCEAVAINLHHQGERIRAVYGDRFQGLPITYSEEPELLGTLGALGPLREFFAGSERILVINGDSVCRWPLRRLLRRHGRTGARATLLLARRPDPRRFGGGVGVGKDRRVLSLFGDDRNRGEVAARYVFAGAHVFEGELLSRVPAGPADSVRDLYRPLLDEGARIMAVTTRQRWHDLGTPRRYLEGVLDLARGRPVGRPWRRGWRSPAARVDPRAQVQGSVVEAEAEVETDARVSRSLLLPGARVSAGAVVRESILGPGAVVPPGAWVERQVVTPETGPVRPVAGRSMVGGMVFTSLDGSGA
jgi:mannose-1-phosphate guanylyltransferase